MRQIPQRTCTGCMQKKNKNELIRIVKNKNGVESIENDDRRCEVVNIAARDKEFVDEVCNVINYNSDK